MNFHQPPSAYIRRLTLKVSDLTRSLLFYEDLLGLSVVNRSSTDADLGVTSDSKVLLTLTQPTQTTPLQANATGLYHFAILLPTREAFAQMAVHLSKRGVRFGSSDHLVSEALYLSDPDGNGIEIYRDRPNKEWTWNNDQVKMTVDPLDFADLLSNVETVNEWSGMPLGSIIGHIHLHVANIAQSERFYCDGLHFEVMTRYGEQASFLATGGYHHHIGINTWQGVGASPPLASSVGLLHYTLAYPDEQSRARVLDDLQKLGAPVFAYGDGFQTVDPAGNVMILDIHREGR
jgi:catechol 2,3-dioxygenase